jgi:hypothetical protein
MANLKVLVASLLLWSIPGAFMQREDIVAGALMARAAESFGTIMDGEPPEAAAAVVATKYMSCYLLLGSSEDCTTQYSACVLLFMHVRATKRAAAAGFVKAASKPPALVAGTGSLCMQTMQPRLGAINRLRGH